MIRAVFLFLLVMALIGLAGKWTRPRKVGRKSAGPPIATARKCPKCGTYLIGGGPCTCSLPAEDPAKDPKANG